MIFKESKISPNIKSHATFPSEKLFEKFFISFYFSLSEFKEMSFLILREQPAPSLATSGGSGVFSLRFQKRA